MAGRLYTEKEIGDAVVEYWKERGCEVWCEVQPGRGWPVADVVADVGGRLAVTECKTSFGLRVLEQAFKWQTWATWVYAAAPVRSGGPLAAKVCEAFGVGLLSVFTSHCDCTVGARINKRTFPELRNALCDAQKASVAGSTSGGQWTPFKQTCHEVAKYVAAHPGCGMREAVENVSHHYRKDTTATACLVRWAKDGKLPGTRIDQDGRRLRLYPTKQEKP